MWGMFTDREEEPPFDLGTFYFVKKTYYYAKTSR